MADEYIKREAVMQKFADHVKRSNNSDFASTPTWNQAVQIVEDIPIADVAPRCPHYIRNVHNRGDDSLCKKWGCEVKEVQPVRHGRWERYSQGQPFPVNGSRKTVRVVYCDWFRCSECGVGFEAKTSYCPNCGAKMQGDTNE